MTRRRRVILVLGTLAALFAGYEAFTGVVAYTADAFVRSDLVRVAPEVTGRIVAVHVADNQAVKRGDRLASIDPVPFELAVAQHQAEVDEAEAVLAADRPALQTAQDGLASAIAARDDAADRQRRAAALIGAGDVSRAVLDDANDGLRIAQAAVDKGQAGLAAAQAAAVLHEAALARARAGMALAKWRLSRTKITAPADGAVTALTLHPGDTATADTPLIGIVDAHAWRVVANYKQDYVARFRPGGTAWVWLDAQPWHFRRARIERVARGISREPETERLLPYVAPTTDWIRLQRRFPVTLTLVDEAGAVLLMGADARVVIFP